MHVWPAWTFQTMPSGKWKSPSSLWKLQQPSGAYCEVTVSHLEFRNTRCSGCCLRCSAQQLLLRVQLLLCDRSRHATRSHRPLFRHYQEVSKGAFSIRSGTSHFALCLSSLLFISAINVHFDCFGLCVTIAFCLSSIPQPTRLSLYHFPNYQYFS